MPKVVDHDQRRREIADGLWAVVEEQGAGAVSVRTVAAKIGMSKTNLSHYFPTFGQLVGFAVAETIADVEAAAESLDLSDCDPQTATRAAMLLIPTTAKRRRQSDVWLMLLGQHDTDPTLAPVLRQLNESVRAGVQRLLQLMADQGHLHPSRDIAQEAAQLHALIDGLSVQTVADRPFMPTAEIKRIVANYFNQLSVPVG